MRIERREQEPRPRAADVAQEQANSRLESVEHYLDSRFWSRLQEYISHEMAASTLSISRGVAAAQVLDNGPITRLELDAEWDLVVEQAKRAQSPLTNTWGRLQNPLPTDSGISICSMLGLLKDAEGDGAKQSVLARFAATSMQESRRGIWEGSIAMAGAIRTFLPPDLQTAVPRLTDEQVASIGETLSGGLSFGVHATAERAALLTLALADSAEIDDEYRVTWHHRTPGEQEQALPPREQV